MAMNEIIRFYGEDSKKVSKMRDLINLSKNLN